MMDLRNFVFGRGSPTINVPKLTLQREASERLSSRDFVSRAEGRKAVLAINAMSRVRETGCEECSEGCMS